MNPSVDTNPGPHTPADLAARAVAEAAKRQRFEAWIGAPPYEKDLDRFPARPEGYAWPGQYRDLTVQLAWEAWCEAVQR